MKKFILISTLMSFSLALTACGGGATSTASALGPRTDSSGLTTNYTNAVPIETQLLVGTFKLEGTDKAVNAKQAGDLVAYWQLLKDLTTSGSAAQEEIDATVEAIESIMTKDQINAIISMQITRQDMFTILRQQGSGFGTGTQSNQSQGSNSQRNSSFGPPGGFGAGGPSNGGFGGGGFPGSGFGSQQSNTNRTSNGQSTNSNGFAGSRVPSALLDAVIALLQSKTQS